MKKTGNTKRFRGSTYMSSEWWRAKPIHCRVCLCGGGTLIKVEKGIYQHKDPLMCKAAKVRQETVEKQEAQRQRLQVAPA